MKKIKYILTSLLTICLCFNVLKINTFAFDSTPTYYNTTHYQVTITSETFNGAGGYVYSMTKLSFNTKNSDPYKGIITLQYTYNANNVRQNLSNWDILCEGCTINSLNNTSGNFKIQTFGYTQFTVTLLYNSGSSSGSGVDNFNFSGMAESSVSVVTDLVETNTSSIDTKLTTTNSTLTIIQGKLDTANANLSSIITNTNDIETYLNQQDNGTYYDTDIETLLSGCKSELNGIYNYTTLNEALLNNIASSIGSLSNVTNGESIVSCINTIKNSQTQLVTNTNNIYSALGNIATNQTSIINSLTSMGADLSSIASTIASVNATSANIYSAIISMKTTLEGYEQYIDNIEGLITNQNTLISNLDNKLNNITWNNISNANIYWSNELTGDTSKWYQTNTSNTYQKIYIYFNQLPGSTEQIDKLDFVLYNNTNYTEMDIDYIGVINGQYVVRNDNIDLYYNYSRYHTYIYLYDQHIGSNYIYNVIEVSANDRYITFEYDNPNNKLQYITSDDIDYWDLIAYFHQNAEYNRIYNILKTINDSQIDYSTYIDSIETLLTNLNNAQQDYSSILNDIENEVDGVEELLGILTAALSLEGAGIFAEIGVGVSTIVSALTVTDAATGITKTIWDWLKDLLDMSADIADITDNIDTAIGNVINSINRIDSLIDTISWDNVVNYNIYWSDKLTADMTQWYNTNTPTNTYDKIYIYINNLPNSVEQIDKLDLVLYNNTNYTEMDIDYIGVINGNYVVRNDYIDTYCNYSKYHTYIYFFDQDISTGSVYNILEVTANNRFVNFEIENAYNNIQYLTSNDIEYWNLITYFDQYQTNKQMLKGLLIDVDTETSIAQYNRDHETVTQIENDLTTLFNQTQPYVDSQLAPLDNQTFFDKLSNNSKLFDYIFRGVFDTDDSLEVSGTVTNPIFLLVIFAGVFLALVG